MSEPSMDERDLYLAGYEFALIHLDDEPVQADLARLRPDRPVQVTTAEAEAWEEGWEAGCNDQQYGNEDAEPWTPNPYHADALDNRPQVTP